MSNTWLRRLINGLGVNGTKLGWLVIIGHTMLGIVNKCWLGIGHLTDAILGGYKPITGNTNNVLNCWFWLTTDLKGNCGARSVDLPLIIRRSQ